MKREELKELGLSIEQVEAIMKINGEDLESLKLKHKAEAEELTRLREEMSERDKQLESLKGVSGASEELKKEVERLQAENKNKEESYQKELQELKFNFELEKVLTSEKARNIKAIKPLLDLTLLKLEDGKIKGLSEQLEKLKQSDGYLFEQSEPNENIKQPTFKGVSPAKTNMTDTGMDTSKLSYSELVKFLENNPNVKLKE